jgi:hypothetical protein
VTDAGWGEIVSAIALVLLTFALTFLKRRRVWVVTADTVTYSRTTPGAGGADPQTVSVTLDKGAVIPDKDVADDLVDSDKRVRKTVSPMRLLVIGADNRTSTSKTVALAWTYAILFGLFAIVVAKWIGDETGYQSLVDKGVREEYWLLLGGPYAAAIASKYATTSQDQGSGKTSGTIDGANVAQLVTNDQGNGDLGDFQYVAFNLVALLFFLGTFIPHLNDGLPELPRVLTGLALTSAGAYSAKKFLQQAPPTLSSLLPTSTPLGSADQPSTIEVWGNNLILPASVAPDGTARAPSVLIDGVVATVTASQETMGADHLTVQVPATLKAGKQVKVAAVRADGVAATAPGGTDSLTLSITA